MEVDSVTTSTSVRFLDDDDDEEDEEEVDHPEEVVNDDDAALDLVGGTEADLMLEDGERILEEAANSADDLLFIDSLDFGENQFVIAE